MSDTFRNIIETEKQEILEWIEEVEDGGVITLTSFKWKDIKIEWHGDFRILVEGVFYESYEEALDEVEKMIYEKYGVKR